MDYLLILSHSSAAIASLYLFLLHIIKRRGISINRIFSLMSFIVFLQYSVMTAINIFPVIASETIIVKILVFAPSVIFALSVLIFSMYPLGKLREALIPAGIIILVLATDFIFLIFLSSALNFDSSMGVPKNSLTISQLMLAIIFMATAPVILLLKTVRQSMNRIRNTVMHYMIGFLVFFIIFIITYFSGYYLYDLSLMNNPFISIPVIYMLILTNYLLLNLRNNDFPKFYKETLMITLILAVYAIPAYFFLKYSSMIKIQPVIALFIKSTALFIWLVACYRLLNPLRIYFINRKRNRLIDQVNDILVPVHELRKITDMEKFWSFITKDNFQGLQKGFGIQSAYFMLINRKDRGYHFTYGFGPGIEPDFLSSDSIIVKRLSSYTGIFEKSYILTDTELEGVENEIDTFFTKNRLEAVIPFRNMSDMVIGFLFLGAIEGRKGFNTDILAALEIFRIKLQNFLTTGLILDEVTADQVNDHDRIVVDTIKKRILPVEMVSMPGIRMSSLHINNSSMGGDYLDSVKIGKESSILFIADTSYSGIDSALISLQLYSILHSRTMVFNSAEKVLNTMNQVLKTSRISGNQVKAACAIVSSDGDYTYSGASFNPLIIYDSETGKQTEVETTGIPLGIEMNYRYTLTTAKLREGSLGVLYSDGVITACNDEGEAYSVERIIGIVSKFAKQNPSIIIREIYRDFSHFTGKKEQMNDFSLIVFKKVKTADE